MVTLVIEGREVTLSADEVITNLNAGEQINLKVSQGVTFESDLFGEDSNDVKITFFNEDGTSFSIILENMGNLLANNVADFELLNILEVDSNGDLTGEVLASFTDLASASASTAAGEGTSSQNPNANNFGDNNDDDNDNNNNDDDDETEGDLDDIPAGAAAGGAAGGGAVTITGDIADAVLEDGDLIAAGELDAVNSQNITVAFAPLTAVAGVYGTFSVTASGAWIYELYADDGSALGDGVQALVEGQIETEAFVVLSEDGTASTVVTITVTGSNDQPILEEITSTGDLIEEDGEAVLTVNGDIEFSDVDLTDIVELSQTYNNDIQWSNGELSEDLIESLTSGFSVLTLDNTAPSGNGSWTYTTDDNLDFLAEGETITLSFDVIATDDSEGLDASASNISEPQTVSITITGTNDQPTINELSEEGEGEVEEETETSAFWSLVAEGADAETISELVEVIDVDNEGSGTINPEDGSAIRFVVETSEGETVSFNWDFIDAEEINVEDVEEEEAEYNDFSFVIVDGVLSILEESLDVDVNGNTVFSYEFEDAGEHTIVFGVMNSGDDSVDSSLNIQHLSGGTIVDSESVGNVRLITSSGISDENVSGNGTSTIVLSGNITQLDEEDDRGSIDYWHFTHNGGPISFDVLTEYGDEDYNDLNGDDEQQELDSYIYLYQDTGSYNDDSFVDSNDDSDFDDEEEGEGNADGSVDTYDSYLSLEELPAGNYVLVVGGYSLSEDSIQDGFNDDSEYEGPYEVTIQSENAATINSLTNGAESSSGDSGEIPGVVESGNGTGTVIATGNIVQLDDDDDSGSIDYWHFEHNGGPLTIDMLTEYGDEDFNDINNDGEQTELDSYIYLYRDTGSYDEESYVDDNDDSSFGESGSGEGGDADGSVDTYDSYLNFDDLPAGNYVLVVGGYDLEDYSIQDGYNENSDYEGPYQITFSSENGITISGADASSDEGITETVQVGEVDDIFTSYAGEISGTDDDINDTHSISLIDVWSGEEDGEGESEGWSDGEEITIMSNDEQEFIGKIDFSGDLDVSDFEPLEVTFTQTLDSNGAFAYDYHFMGDFNALGVGESATVTFSYQVSDNSEGEVESNLTQPQDIQLVITGTNDQPVVQEIDAGSIFESHDSNDVLGVDDTKADVLTTFVATLDTVSDDDVNDTHTYQVVEDSVEINGEEVSNDLVDIYYVTGEDGDGHWEYKIEGDFNYLSSGDSATVTFLYTARDDSGANNESNVSEAKQIQLVINGTNDQPVIENVNINGEGNGGEGTAVYSTLDHDDFSYIDSYYGQTFRAQDTTLSQIEFDLADHSVGDFRIEIRDSSGNTIYTSEIAHATGEGENIVTIPINQQNGEELTLNSFYNLYVVNEAGSNVNMEFSYSSSNSGQTIPNDGQGLTYGNNLAAYDNYHDFKLKLTFANGTEEILETNGVEEIYAGTLVLSEDLDTSDTHTFQQVGSAEVSTNSAAVVTNLAVVVNADGTYTIDGNFDALADGELATVTFKYTATDDSGSESESAVSESKTVTLTVTGTNDAPIITDVDLAGVVIEDDSSSPLTDSGSFAFTDVDVSDVHSASVTNTSSTHSSVLGSIVLTLTDTTGSGVGGAVDWNYSVDNTAVEFLGINDTITETHTITFTDNEGFTTTRDVTVTITGTNDEPILASTDVIGAVTEDIGDSSESNNLAGEEVIEEFSASGPETGLRITVNGNDVTASNQNGYYYSDRYDGNYGVRDYGLNVQSVTADALVEFPDDVLSFSFRAGAVNGANEFIQVNYTDGSTQNIQVTDTTGSNHDGFSHTRLVSVDAPEGKLISGFNILDGTDYWLLDGITYTYPQGNEEENEVVSLSDNGLIAFTDLDLSDTHIVSVIESEDEQTTNLGTLSAYITEDNDTDSVGEVRWDYSVENADVQYLGENETKTETFTVRLEDKDASGNLIGTYSDQVVTITVTGTNDQPIVSNVEISANESDGTEEIYAGNLVVTQEIDTIDTHTFQQVGSAQASTNSEAVVTDLSVVVGENGAYTIDGNFDALADGEIATVTFQYTATDDSGTDSAISEAKTVTLTVTGTNDQPIVEDISISATESDGIEEIYAGTLLLSEDLDTTDTHTFQQVGNAQVSTNSAAVISDLAVVVDENGAYTIDGNFDALAAGELATVTFQYTSTDDSGTDSAISEAKTVTLTVTGTNDGPVAVDDGSVNHVMSFDNINDTLVTPVFDFTSSGYSVMVDINHSTNDRWDTIFEFEVGSDMHYIGIYYGQLAVWNDGQGTIGSFSNIELNTSTNVAISVEPSGTFSIYLDGNLEGGGHFNSFAQSAISFGGKGTSEIFAGTMDNIEIYDSPLSSSEIGLLAEGSSISENPIASYDFEGENALSDKSGNGHDLTAFGNPVLLEVDGSGLATLENNLIEIDVLANDTDLDTTDVLSIDSFTQAQNGGLVQLNENGDKLEFDPGSDFDYLAEGESVTISFDYTVIDLENAKDTASVTLIITGTNDQPIITEASASDVLENALSGSITETVTDLDVSDGYEFVAGTVEAEVLESAQSGDTDIVSNMMVSIDASGDYVVSGDGIENLAEGETVTISFEVQVTDGSLGLNGGESAISESRVVTLMITGTNDQPIIEEALASDVLETDLRGSITETVSDIDLNDGYEFVAESIEATVLESAQVGDGENIVSNMMVDLDTNGDYVVSGDGIENLGAGETASISFDVRVTDGSNGDNEGESAISETVTLTLLITGTNDQPVITSLTSETALEVTENTSDDTNITTITENFVVNDIDSNDNPITNFDVVSITNLGQIQEGYILYNNVDYTAQNGDFGNVRVQIKLPEDITEDDISIDSLVVNLDGTFTIEGNFEALKVEDEMFISFIYNANDGQGFDGTDGLNETSLSENGVMTLKVMGTNDAPVASVHSGELNDTPEVDNLSISIDVVTDDRLADVNDLMEAYFVESDSLEIVSILDSSGNALEVDMSKLSLRVDGNNIDFDAQDAFDFLDDSEVANITINYNLSDSIASTRSTLELRVNGTNDKPIIAEQEFTIYEHDVLDHNLHEVEGGESNAYNAELNNLGDSFVGNLAVTDAENDILQYRITAVDGVSTTSISYVPIFFMDSGNGDIHLLQNVSAEDATSYALTVQVTDGKSSFITKVITVNIADLNDEVPTAIDDFPSTIENQSLLVDVISNDTDADVVYNELSLDSIDEASITLEWKDGNAVIDTGSWDAQTGTITLASNGETIVTENPFTIVDGQVQFTSAANGSSQFDFIAEGETLTINIDYTVVDNADSFDVQYSDIGTVSLTLTGTNDQPIVEDVVINATETGGIEEVYSGTLVLSEDLDVTDTHTFQQVGEADVSTNSDAGISDLAVLVNEDGTYTIEGNFDALADGEVATVTFDYTATDSSGAENAISESKTVTLEITGTNDQPIVENIAANENGDDIVEVVGLNALDNTLYSGYYLSTVQQTFIATEDSLSNIELEVYAIGYSNGYYDGTFQVQVLDAQGNEISLSSPINSGDTEITGNTHGVPSGIISIDLDASLDIESTYTINFIVLSGNPLIVSRVAENSSDGLGIVYNNNSLQDYSDLAIKLTYETGGLVVFETGNETNTTFVETLDTVSDLDTTDTHTYQVVADSVEINGVAVSDELASIYYVDDGEGSGHWEYKVEGDFNYLSEGEIARVTFDYTATDDSGVSNDVSDAKTISLKITGTNDQPIVEDINANIQPVGGFDSLENSYYSHIDSYYGQRFIATSENLSLIELNFYDGSYGTYQVHITDSSGNIVGTSEVGTVDRVGDNISSVGIDTSLTIGEGYTLRFVSISGNPYVEMTNENVVANDGQGMTRILDAPNYVRYDSLYDLKVKLSYDTGEAVVFEESIDAVNTTLIADLDTVSDLDVNDSHSYQVVEGSVQVNASDVGDSLVSIYYDTDHWEYKIEGDFNYLALGEVATVTFDYTATDSSGAENAISESKTVTLEITGTNDQPIVKTIDANENGDDIVEVVGLNALDNALYSGTYLYSVQQTFIATENSLSNIELEVYAIGYSGGQYDGTFQVQILDAQGNEISLSSPINSADTEITGNTHGVPSGIISIDMDTNLNIDSTYTINFIVLSGNPLIVTRVAENSSDGLGIVYSNNSLQDYSDLAIKLTYETGGLVVFETGNETNTTFVETLDTVSDLDTTDTHTYQVVADSVEINGVAVSDELASIYYVDDGEGSGHWEYKVEGDFNYLSEGEIARVTFDYTATDDSGVSNDVSDAKTISLKITGTNDQPIVEDINANILPVAGFDSLDNSLYSNRDLRFGQKFIASEENLSLVELNFLNGMTGTYQVQITDSSGSVIGTSDVGNADGTGENISSVSLDVNLTIGEGYGLQIVPLSGNLRMEYTTQNVVANDGQGMTYIYDAPNYVRYDNYFDLKLKLSYDTGVPVVFEESLDAVNTTFIADLNTVSDLDVNDSHSYQVVAGSVQVNASDVGDSLVSIYYVTDHWEYKIEGDFNYLAEGEVATVTFDYTATDSSGAENAISEAKTVTLEITGTNDQPVVENIGEVVGLDTLDNTLSGTLSSYYSQRFIATDDMLSQVEFNFYGNYTGTFKAQLLDSSGNVIHTTENMTVDGVGENITAVPLNVALTQGEFYNIGIIDVVGNTVYLEMSNDVVGSSDGQGLSNSGVLQYDQYDVKIKLTYGDGTNVVYEAEGNVDNTVFTATLDTVSDADVTDTQTYQVVSGSVKVDGVSVADALASIYYVTAEDGSGHWEYKVDGDFNYLDGGEIAKVTFDYTARDDSGASNDLSAAKTITLDVIGTSGAAPVIQTGNAGGDVADILANTNESGYVRSPVITNLENGGYVTTWEADNSLYAQIFNANGVAQHLDESGTPIDIKVSINTSGASSLTTIGLPNGDFVVTWIGYDSSLGDNVVFTQVFDQDGNAQNVDESGNQVDIRVSTDIGKSAYDQSMTELSDGGFVVTWEAYQRVGTVETYEIYAQVFDENGVAQTETNIQVNSQTSGRQENPEVTALSNGKFAIVWETDGVSVHGQVFDNLGNPVHVDSNNETLDIQIYQNNSGRMYQQEITALSDGNFAVTWIKWNSSIGTEGVFVRIFDESGLAVTDEILINPNDGVNFQRYPEITDLSNNTFAISWQSYNQAGDARLGIFAQVFNYAGIALNVDANDVPEDIHVNTVHTTNADWLGRSDQDNHSIVALDDGKFVITWESDHGDDAYTGNGVFAQVFDSNLNPLNLDENGNPAEIGLSTIVQGSQIIPEVTSLNDGGFAVVWASYSSAENGTGIFTQVFNSDGTVRVGASDLLMDINENAIEGTIVGTVVATDSDSSELFYSLVDANGDEIAHDKFEINANGEILVKGDLNYEDANAYDLNVKVSDRGQSDIETVHIELNDVTATVNVIGADEIMTFNSDAQSIDMLSILSQSDDIVDNNGTVIGNLDSLDEIDISDEVNHILSNITIDSVRGMTDSDNTLTINVDTGDTLELDLGAVVTNADQVSEDDQWHEVENEDPSGPTVYVGKIEDDVITLLVHGDEVLD